MKGTIAISTSIHYPGKNKAGSSVAFDELER